MSGFLTHISHLKDSISQLSMYSSDMDDEELHGTISQIDKEIKGLTKGLLKDSSIDTASLRKLTEIWNKTKASIKPHAPADTTALDNSVAKIGKCLLLPTSETGEVPKKESRKEQYEEFICRLSPLEKAEFIKKVALAKLPERKQDVEQVARFLNEEAKFIDQDNRKEVFSDPLAPQLAVQAFLRGAISMTQLSTFLIHLHLHTHQGEKAELVPLFGSKGEVNPKAKKLLLSSVENGDEIARIIGVTRLTQYSLDPSKKQVEQILERMRNLPPSERVFITFPDTQHALRPTISQVVSSVIIFGNRALSDSKLLRTAFSMGLMEATVEVTRHGGAKMDIHPVLGLSSRALIELGQYNDYRDMFIPCPGIIVPEEADGSIAPSEDGDFLTHDWFHLMRINRIDRKEVETFLYIYRMLPGYSDSASEEEQAFANRFLDLDVAGSCGRKESTISECILSDIRGTLFLYENRGFTGIPYLDSPQYRENLEHIGLALAQIDKQSGWIGGLKSIYNAFMVGFSTKPDPSVQALLRGWKKSNINQEFEQWLLSLDPDILKLPSFVDEKTPSPTVIPPCISRFKKLKTLDLSKMGFVTIAEEIKDLTSLKELIFPKDKDIELPKILPPNIERLNLRNMGVQSIPKEWGNLKKLTHLVMSGNKLESLPKEIFNLTNLKVLNVRGNNFSSLPEEIGKLVELRILNVEGNQLTALPKTLGSLSKLSEIYVGKNQLKALSPELAKLDELEIVNITGNPDLVLGSELKGSVQFIKAVEEGNG